MSVTVRKTTTYPFINEDVLVFTRSGTVQGRVTQVTRDNTNAPIHVGLIDLAGDMKFIPWHAVDQINILPG